MLPGNIDTIYRVAIMLFSMDRNDRSTLSLRSRIFIRIHHLAVVGLVAWVGYLFAVRELV